MEVFAFISGLLYLILEIKQSKLMWIIGALSAMAYIYIFARSSLFAAMGLQIYYLAVSIYGFYEWQRDKAKGKESGSGSDIFYRIIPFKSLIVSLLFALIVFMLLLTILRNMTGDPMPAVDALATSLSIMATLWLSKSFIHQWLVWIAVDLLSAGLFISQGLYLTSVLYIIYTVSAAYGYCHWKKNGLQVR